jgi:hypothetical protein
MLPTYESNALAYANVIIVSLCYTHPNSPYFKAFSTRGLEELPKVFILQHLE